MPAVARELSGDLVEQDVAEGGNSTAEDDHRLADNRSAHRDPLALAAGELWNTAMSRWRGWKSVMSRPSTDLVPAVTSSRPAIILSMVDLPQPDGPTRTRNSPSGKDALVPVGAMAASVAVLLLLSEPHAAGAIVRAAKPAASLHSHMSSP